MPDWPAYPPGMTEDDREAKRLRARAALQKADWDDRPRLVKQFVATHWKWLVTAATAVIVPVIVALIMAD